MSVKSITRRTVFDDAVARENPTRIAPVSIVDEWRSRDEDIWPDPITTALRMSAMSAITMSTSMRVIPLDGECRAVLSARSLPLAVLRNAPRVSTARGWPDTWAFVSFSLSSSLADLLSLSCSLADVLSLSCSLADVLSLSCSLGDVLSLSCSLADVLPLADVLSLADVLLLSARDAQGERETGREGVRASFRDFEVSCSVRLEVSQGERETRRIQRSGETRHRVGRIAQVFS